VGLQHQLALAILLWLAVLAVVRRVLLLALVLAAVLVVIENQL
jgi:hypothetical protein